jgi:hypothetical protein
MHKLIFARAWFMACGLGVIGSVISAQLTLAQSGPSFRIKSIAFPG